MRMPTLVLAAAVWVALGVGLPTESCRAGDLQEQGFGKERGGLALRAEPSAQPIGGSPLPLAVDVELRATRAEAVSQSVSRAVSFSGKLVWVTKDGKPLPEGIVRWPSRSPLDAETIELESGKSLRWTVEFLRVADSAPRKLEIQAQLAGGRAVRFGSPKLASAALTLDFTRRPVPKPLEKKHVAAGWTSGMRMIYFLYEGLRGWRMLEIQTNGNAHVFRSKLHGDQVHGDRVPGREVEDLQPGEFSARLTTSEQEALATVFTKQRVWELDDLPERMLIPDEASARLTLLADDAALFARYPIAEALKGNAGYADLARELDAIMHRLLARAKK